MKYSNLEFFEINKAVLDKNHAVEFRAYGGSMRPFIKAGDILTIAPSSLASIRIGDIVAHKTQDDAFVIHRVISRVKTDKGIIVKTKGDAEVRRRIPVVETQLLGKVVALKRAGHMLKLEGRAGKMINIFWLGISQINPFVYPPARWINRGIRFVGRRLLQSIQRVKIYRILVKKTMRYPIDYTVAQLDDATALAYFYGYDKSSDFLKSVESLKEQICDVSSGECFLLAKRKGKIVGGICVGREEEDKTSNEVWRIDSLMVHWMSRGKGIGSKLVEVATQAAEDNGARCLRLFVFKNSKSAQELYAKMGFRRVFISEIDAYLEKEAQAGARQRIILEKQLEINQNNFRAQRFLLRENDLSPERKIETISAYFAIPRDNDPRSIDQIKKTVESDFDWKNFFNQAQKEGLAPIIYKRMLKNEAIKSVIAPEVHSKFKKSYYAVVRCNLLLLEHTKSVLKAFQDESIKALILKGIMLAEVVYKDIGARPMGDIDILIKKDDLAKADQVLLSLGYTKPRYYQSYLENQNPNSINSLMYNIDNSMRPAIHLHWHLINSTWPLDYWVKKIDMQRIWDQAELIRIGDLEVFTLAGYHLLIYLSLHAFTHGFDRLILVSDIAEVLQRDKDTIDWDIVKTESERFCASLIIYYVLYYTQQRLNITIPEIEHIRPEKIGFPEKRLEMLFKDAVRGYKLSYLTYLLLHKRLPDKVRFIWKTIFPSRLTLANNLNLSPDEISSLSYCKRIFNNFSKIL